MTRPVTPTRPTGGTPLRSELHRLGTPLAGATDRLAGGLRTVDRVTDRVVGTVDEVCTRLTGVAPGPATGVVDAACTVVTGLTRTVTDLVPRPPGGGQPSSPSTPPGVTPPLTGPAAGGGAGPVGFPPRQDSRDRTAASAPAPVSQVGALAVPIGPVVTASTGTVPVGTGERPVEQSSQPTPPAPLPGPSHDGDRRVEALGGAGAGPALHDTGTDGFKDSYVRVFDHPAGPLSPRAPSVATRPG